MSLLFPVNIMTGNFSVLLQIICKKNLWYVIDNNSYWYNDIFICMYVHICMCVLYIIYDIQLSRIFRCFQTFCYLMKSLKKPMYFLYIPGLFIFYLEFINQSMLQVSFSKSWLWGTLLCSKFLCRGRAWS